MSTPMIRRLVDGRRPQEMEDALHRLNLNECVTLAAEIRTLLAERDNWKGLFEQWQNKADALQDQLIQRNNELLEARANTFPAPPRRLREYVSRIEGVTRRYRVLNGVLKVSGDGGAWVEATTVYVADAAGVSDLLANPEEPVETLEDVVRQWDYEPRGVTREDELADLCTRLRAWLAQQTPSMDRWTYDDFRTDVLKTLTVSDHIAALVEMGAWRANRVDVERSSAHRQELHPHDGRLVVAEDRNVLILPPESP